MGVKKRFIEMIKSGYPSFNPESDSVEIEFEGGGDSFGSFSYIQVYPSSEGSVDLEDFFELLMDILYESGVEYNWNNAGTTGSIKYNEGGYQELSVYTIVSEEYWGEIEDDGDDEEETSIPDEIKDALMDAPEIDFNSIDPSVITYYNDNKSEGETSKDETNG